MTQLGLESLNKEPEISEKLAALLEPLLKRMRLEAIPTAVLERKVEALGLISPPELLEASLSASTDYVSGPILRLQRIALCSLDSDIKVSWEDFNLIRFQTPWISACLRA